jgi:glycerol-3-phosphate dehydrogenase (NAD(P)+)
MMKRVAVIGAGSWGTTVAMLASHNAKTTLWARRPELAEEIDREHTNRRYLGDVSLPGDLRAVASIEEAVASADVVVMGVPSHGLRSVLGEVVHFLRPGVPVVSLAKGLEEGTQLRMTQVIQEVAPGHPYGVLTGPNLAGEILAGYAAASVVAMSEDVVARELQAVFSTGLFRVYTNRDVIGCEIGGAMKNVIAIACGMGDGVGVGDNTRSAVITRGLAELTRLGETLGAEPRTLAGLAGMGDLVATCISPHSRNRQVGEQLARGKPIEEIISEMHMVAEGVKTCRVVMEIAARQEIEMPIAREVYGAVYEGKSALKAYRGLLRHAPGSEDEPG